MVCCKRIYNITLCCKRTISEWGQLVWNVTRNNPTELLSNECIPTDPCSENTIHAGRIDCWSRPYFIFRNGPRALPGSKVTSDDRQSLFICDEWQRIVNVNISVSDVTSSFLYDGRMEQFWLFQYIANNWFQQEVFHIYANTNLWENSYYCCNFN